MNESPEESCSSSLQKWATNVMAYSGAMSAQDWKQLCQDDLGSFWLKIINSTRPQKFVATLKSTLLSQSRMSMASKPKKDDKWKALMDQRNKLAREHAALQNGIRLKDAEIDGIQAKLSSLEQDQDISRDASTELVTRCSLLSSHMMSCSQWYQVINEYQQRVKAHYEYLARHRGNTGDVSYVVSRTSGHDTLELLTMHVVKDALFCIKQLLSILTSQTTDKSAVVQEAKGRAWKSVEELLGNHPLGDILRSLCDVTKETEKQLRSHTCKINLKQDTKQLRFHCQRNSGELKDISNQSSLRQAICSHIKTAQLDHVSHSRTAEQAQLAVKSLQQKLVMLQQQVCELVERHYQSRPQLLLLTKNLMELECELAGGRAALQTLLSNENSLHKTCEEQQSFLQELNEKHKRIEEYSSRSATKQSKIELLIRQNSNAKHQLLKQRREVISYAQQQVISHHSMLAVSADNLLDTSDSESLLLSKLKLRHLPEHDINRNDIVVAVLGCPGYQAHELTLEKALELLQQVGQLRKELQENQMNLNSVKLDTNLFEVHERLMDDTSQHVGQVILPQLHNQLQKTNNDVQQCINISSAIDEWWEQPAQLLVPWVTQQGMNMNQWLEQWRTLLTHLE